MANFADVQHCICADIHNGLVGQKRPKLCWRNIGMASIYQGTAYHVQVHFILYVRLIWKKNFTNKVELDDHCILTQGWIMTMQLHDCNHVEKKIPLCRFVYFTHTLHFDVYNGLSVNLKRGIQNICFNLSKPDILYSQVRIIIKGILSNPLDRPKTKY